MKTLVAFAVVTAATLSVPGAAQAQRYQSINRKRGVRTAVYAAWAVG